MTIEDVLTRSERDEEHAYRAEQLRIKGELIMFEGAPGAASRASIVSAKPWRRRAARVPCLWNCVPPLAFCGCGEISVASATPAIYWRWYTAASPKVSRRRTCKKRSGC